MDKKLAQLLVDVTDEARLSEDYSGRGMYGKETTGVVVPSEGDILIGILDNIHQVADEIEDENIEIPRGFQTDSMGRDIILY